MKQVVTKVKQVLQTINIYLLKTSSTFIPIFNICGALIESRFASEIQFLGYDNCDNVYNDYENYYFRHYYC
jgi:hypothetical protein